VQEGVTAEFNLRGTVLEFGGLLSRNTKDQEMKRLLVASIMLAMAAPAFSQTRTQSQTRTSDPDSTMTEMQKGGPASKESKPGAAGQQKVVKGNSGTPDARKVPTPPPPR
jgi:hypothetical protein